MAHPRVRDDRCFAVYHVTNALVGQPGELMLDEKQVRKLSLLIRQADRLFCGAVVSFAVTPTGYSLVCTAPPGSAVRRRSAGPLYGPLW